MHRCIKKIGRQKKKKKKRKHFNRSLAGSRSYFITFSCNTRVAITREKYVVNKCMKSYRGLITKRGINNETTVALGNKWKPILLPDNGWVLIQSKIMVVQKLQLDSSGFNFSLFLFLLLLPSFFYPFETIIPKIDSCNDRYNVTCL